METITVGMIGQNYAEHFLRKKEGYRFVERNWRARFGEIDLVFQHQARYVFIEVKTMVKMNTFQPEDHLTFSKEKTLRKLTRLYLGHKNFFAVQYQIDLAAVDVDENYSLLEVRHYSNIIEDIS